MPKDATIIMAMVLATSVFVMPRKWFLLPFIAAACFIPADQRFIVGGLDFTMLRILVIAGVARLMLYNEIVSIKYNRVDMLLVAWIAAGGIIYTLQWATPEAFVNRLGHSFDAIGLCWIFRQKIRSWNDLRFVAGAFALCAVALVPFVALEWSTGENPFVALGRVTTVARQGRYRCQAAFPHPIILGLFWATLMPVFIAFARRSGRDWIFAAATAAAVFVIAATASSTPVAVLIQMLILLALWKYRRSARGMLWTAAAVLVALHIIMTKPVWHLIARANIVGGSTGWHRYFLIDQAISRFHEWWLLGTRDTSQWGRGLEDVTNHFILQGVNGGLLTLVLFVALLAVAIKTLWRYSVAAVPRRLQWISWCLGVSLMAHCIAFLAVSYFGQIIMPLYMTIAVSAMVCEMLEQPRPAVVFDPSFIGGEVWTSR